MRMERVRSVAAIGLVRFWKWGLVLTAVLTAFVWGRCGADPDPVTRIVADTVMVEQPTVKPTLTERIVYRPVEVERRVIQERVDTLIVREFVEAAQNPDSLPATHLPYSVEYDGEKLLMWGVLSNGDRTFSETDVRPKFQAGWAGDSTWTREHRLARFPKWKVAAGGAVVGGVILCLVMCR